MSGTGEIVIFHMRGCPACEEHVPLMRQAQSRHPSVPVHYLDVDQYSNDAERFRVENVPTTLLLRKPYVLSRREGLLEPDLIEAFFVEAERI